jgi:hypothetical protein
LAIGHASIITPAAEGLRQREWNRADGEKREQNERAPEKVRLNGGINLFFHCGAFVTFGARRSRFRSAHLGVALTITASSGSTLHELVVDMLASVQAKILTIFWG